MKSTAKILAEAGPIDLTGVRSPRYTCMFVTYGSVSKPFVLVRPVENGLCHLLCTVCVDVVASLPDEFLCYI